MRSWFLAGSRRGTGVSRVLTSAIAIALAGLFITSACGNSEGDGQTPLAPVAQSGCETGKAWSQHVGRYSPSDNTESVGMSRADGETGSTVLAAWHVGQVLGQTTTGRSAKVAEAAHRCYVHTPAHRGRGYLDACDDGLTAQEKSDCLSTCRRKRAETLDNAFASNLRDCLRKNSLQACEEEEDAWWDDHPASDLRRRKELDAATVLRVLDYDEDSIRIIADTCSHVRAMHEHFGLQ